MSTEKWESVTWDLVEREIVDYLLIASKQPSKTQAFLNRLASQRKPDGLSRKPAARQRRSTSNG